MKKLLITSVFMLGVMAGVSGVQAGECPQSSVNNHYYITEQDWNRVVQAYSAADDEVKKYADELVARLSGDMNAKLGDLDFSEAQNIAQEVTYTECDSNGENCKSKVRDTNVTDALLQLDLAVSSNTGRIEDLEDRVDGHDEDISDLQRANDEQNDRLDALESAENDEESRVSELETSVSDLVEENQSQDTRITELETSVSDLVEENQSQDTRITELETSVSDLVEENQSQDTRITELETSVSDLVEENQSQDTRITGLETSVSDLVEENQSQDTRITGLETTVQGHTTMIAQNAQDIDALENIVGDGDFSGAYNISQGSVTEAVMQLDAAIGDVASLQSTHYAQGSNVVDSIIALDNQVHTNTENIKTLAANDVYLESRIDENAAAIVQNAQNIAQNTADIQVLYQNDQALSEQISEAVQVVNNVAGGFESIKGSVSSLNNRVNEIDDKMKTGFASAAALSSLVPNARAIGNTQISVGTGYYDGEFGGAVGLYHYFNDNVLVNAGVSYAGDESLMARLGASFGF